MLILKINYIYIQFTKIHENCLYLNQIIYGGYLETLAEINEHKTLSRKNRKITQINCYIRNKLVILLHIQKQNVKCN